MMLKSDLEEHFFKAIKAMWKNSMSALMLNNQMVNSGRPSREQITPDKI